MHIARYFHSTGIKVSGYDKMRQDLTKELETEGMKYIMKRMWN